MFAIKADVRDPGAEAFAFNQQKTMYGGKHIARGDTIFVFASENEGGPGLIASGIVTSAEAIPRKLGSPGRRRASASPSGAPNLRSAASDGASSGASPTGTMVGPRPSSTLSSIVKQRTRSWASQMKQPHFSAGSSSAANFGMTTSAQRLSGVTPNPPLEPMVRLLMTDCLFDDGSAVAYADIQAAAPDRAGIGGWARRQ